MKNQLSAQWLPSGRRVAPGLAKDVWQVVNSERQQQQLLPQELLLQLQPEPRPLCAPLAQAQPHSASGSSSDSGFDSGIDCCCGTHPPIVQGSFDVVVATVVATVVAIVVVFVVCRRPCARYLQ